MSSYLNRHNSIVSFITFSLLIFIGLGVLQKSNNALPFFYKDYPTYQVNGKQHFDSVSESLVLNRIDFSTLGIEYKYKYNLWRVNSEARSLDDYRKSKPYNFDYITTQEYLLDGQPYRSQIGVQSLLWAKLADALDTKHGDYRLLKTCSLLFLSLSTAMVLVWMKKKLGLIPSLCGLIFIVLSTGINIFSQSLYWSVWLIILPLGAVCLLDVLGIKNKYAVFLVMLPVFLFKFLSGYEFITIVVFAAITPYAWDFILNRNGSALARALSVGTSSVLAFLLSLLVYDATFVSSFNSSGIDHILGKAGSWSIKNLGEIGLSPGIQASKILIMNFLDFNGYGLPLGGFLLITSASLIALKDRITIGGIQFICFLLVGSLSWPIAEPGHILFHPRYAQFIISIPFGLFIVGFVASLVCTEKSPLEKMNV